MSSAAELALDCHGGDEPRCAWYRRPMRVQREGDGWGDHDEVRSDRGVNLVGGHASEARLIWVSFSVGMLCLTPEA